MKLSITKINFGEVVVDEELIKNFNVINDSNYDITATISVNDLNFLVSPISILVKANKTANVIVKFKPQLIQQYSANVTVTAGLVSSQLNVVGIGIKPEISIIPTLLEIGNSAINQSKTAEFTIKNISSKGILKISNIVSSDSKFSVNKTTASILPLEETKVQVTFLSAFSGNYATVISIHNNSLTPIVDLNVTANALVPIIASDKLSLDFGSVAINDFRELDVTLSNNGSVELIISNVVVSSGFTLNSETSYVLQQYETAIIKVKFKPEDSTQLNGKLTIFSNDITTGNLEIDLSGKGSYEPNIEIEDNSLNFGSVALFSNTNKKVRIFNRGTVSLNVVASCSNSVFTVLPTNVSIDPNSFSDLIITFIPDTITSYSENLIINSNDPDSSTILIPLSGVSTIPISVNTNFINFGTNKIGSEAIKKLAITNNSSIDLTVELNSNLTQFSSDNIIVIQSKEKKYVDISYVAIDETENNGILIVSVLATSLQVDLKGKGGSPKILVEDEFNFNNINIGEEKTGTLSISSGNTIPLTVTEVLIDNPNFILSHNFPKTFSKIETISIKHESTFIGLDNAVLTIKSDDFTNPIKLVNISANGVSPDISIDKKIVEFGNVSLNELSTKTIKILNLGDGILTIDSVVFSPNDKFYSDMNNFIIDPKGEYEFIIKFLPTILQEEECEITFSSNDLDTPDIKIQATGIGSTSQIETSLSPIDFGIVSINTILQKTLTIKNVGEAQLAINATVNSLAYVLDELNILLNQQESKELSITFTPSSVQSYPATLNLQTNDINNPNVQIGLVGSGAQLPKANIKPNFIDFSEVPVDTSSQRTIVIKNEGTANLNVGYHFEENYPEFKLTTSAGAAWPENVVKIIAPGTQENFNLNFNPHLIKKVEDVLVFTTDDTNLLTYEILVKAKGVAGILEWSVATLQLPKEIKETAEGLSDILGVFVTVLELLNVVLETVKVFIIDLTDPAKLLIKALITILEQLKKQLEASGIYFLPLLPTESKISPTLTPEAFTGIDVTGLQFAVGDRFNSIKGGSKAFINKICASLDDPADTNRPKFSADAKAGCLVLAMDSGNIFPLIQKIYKMARIFQLEFKVNFNPPSSITGIAGKDKCRVTFTAAEGALPNAYVIFRSEVQGGEFVPCDYIVNGVETKAYWTDRMTGYAVGDYVCVGTTTIWESIMIATGKSEDESRSIFDSGSISAILELMGSPDGLKLVFDDKTNNKTPLQNDKIYYYVVCSASVGDDKKIKEELLGQKYSDLIDIVKYDTAGNKIERLAFKYENLYAIGPKSAEIALMPKSTFIENLTGEARCRHFSCGDTVEKNESLPIDVNRYENIKAGKAISLKNKNIVTSSLDVTISRKNKTENPDIFSIPKNEYHFSQENSTIVFLKPNFFLLNDDLDVTYKIRSFSGKQESIKNQLINVGSLKNDPIITLKSNLEATSLQIQLKYSIDDDIEKTIPLSQENYQILDIYKGRVQLKSNTLTDYLNVNNVTAQCSYSYYAGFESNFKCTNSLFNKTYWQPIECDNGTTLCPGYENRCCFYNVNGSCSNSGISKRIAYKVNEDFTLGASSENIPFIEFYDSVYCQNGITAQRCDGYSKTANRAGYKNPPDWYRTKSMKELFPFLFEIIDYLEDFLKSLLNSIEKMTQAIINFINLIQKKIAYIKSFIQRIKDLVDLLIAMFDIGSVYALHVPINVGGNEYLKSAIKTAKSGPDSGPEGYTAGVVLAYGGVGTAEVAQAAEGVLMLLFGK